MTPWQLCVALHADIEERRHQQELDAWHTWHVAALQRSKKLPAYKNFISKKEDKKEVAARLKATLKAAFPSKQKG